MNAPVKIYEGKVANLYTIEALPGHLLLERTDRISALNSKVMGELKVKGPILNQLSQFWLNGPLKKFPNHLASFESIASAQKQIDIPRDMLKSASIVKKLTQIPIECIVRGHITGSGYKNYQETGRIFGNRAPKRLSDGDMLETPLFTPTEKSDSDDPISFAEMQRQIGAKKARKLREMSMEAFNIGYQYLDERGIILADTKFEFGEDEDGNIYFIDEVLTPDSSRFWVKNDWELATITSYDKQKLRDWLQVEKDTVRWDGKSQIAPPTELLKEMTDDYIKIFEIITGTCPKI